MEHYTIVIFSNEWWINNLTTFSIILVLLLVGKTLNKNNKSKIYSYIIGALLLMRIPWNQWYQQQLGQWDPQWSLPLQMCSFTAIFSGSILIIHNFKIKTKYKTLLFEFLLYWSIGAFYSFITPEFTTGMNGYLYYDYYVSHGGILFSILYCRFILGYKPREKSWLKVFLYSQPILITIHMINYFIGGSSNYFYTMNPPIANNPLVIGAYPTHIILLDIFAAIHFYLIYLLVKEKTNYLKSN